MMHVRINKTLQVIALVAVFLIGASFLRDALSSGVQASEPLILPYNPIEEMVMQHASRIEGKIIIRAINDASKRYGVDAMLIASVIYAESTVYPRAKSHCGAKGLMQLMPCNLKGVANPWSIDQNIDRGTLVLKQNLERFKDPTLALAAYNAGPTLVARVGIPRYKETRYYIQKVFTKLGEIGGDTI